MSRERVNDVTALTGKRVESEPQPTESLFAVPVANRWLVHAPLRGVSAVVNRAAVAALRGGQPGAGEKAFSELEQALCEPEQAPPARGGLRPQFLGLITTRSCNMRCVYCDFGAAGAAPDRMSYETATAAVDWMAGHVTQMGETTLAVHFFGGEPLVAGDVVDVAVHHARAIAAARGLTPRFEVATNGAFDASRARFVGDHFDTVVLSFDGPREIHDRHRPAAPGRGSYESVARTAGRLSDAPAELCLRVCVSRLNVSRLPEIGAWFCETLRPAAIDWETLHASPQSEAAGLQPPDPYEFATSCVRASRVVRDCGVRPVYAAAMSDGPRWSFCPVGNDTLIVSPDGRVSGCYLPEDQWRDRELDLNLGQLGPDGCLQLDPRAVVRLRRMTEDKPRCQRCFCRWTCAGGCHVRNTWPGCGPDYGDFCVQTRLIAACLLLEELGCSALADALLADRAAMEALALHGDDRLGSCSSRSRKTSDEPMQVARRVGPVRPEGERRPTSSWWWAGARSASWSHPTKPYRIAPYVSWAVEIDGVRVLDERSGAVDALRYPRAAVWDLLSRGIRLEKTVPMIAAIAALDARSAEQLVRECVQVWSAAGLVIEE